MNKGRGYYFGHYDFSTDEYFGPDFSRSCFIFSGQGLAFPGMFKDQYLNFKIISEKFKKADFLAKELGLSKISDYILNPAGLAKETLPIIRNLALFTLETALHEVLVSQKIIPQIVTGHSLGEYAALTASGIILFEEMFDIVYHRDLFCPKANEAGFMVAINADEQSIKNILAATEFYVSNLNSPQQTVISVSLGALDEVKQFLIDNKIKHKVLSSVPQPYHSPYLNGVKEKMEQYLKDKQLNLKKPQIPFFSSVTQKLIDEKNFKEENIRYILINQIIVPVVFIRQIPAVYNLRCFNFIGLGANNAWTGFVEDILAGEPVKTDSALNLLKIQKKDTSEAVSPKNKKLFSLISQIIGKITGYEIEKISWEDRYQEDLGIDSIKKAEILLTVLKESNIDPGDDFSTSGFGSIKDTVEYLEGAGQAEKRKKKTVVKKEIRFERYVSVWEARPLKNYIFEPARKIASLLVDSKDISSNQESLLGRVELFLEETGDKERRNIIILSDNFGFNFGTLSFDAFQGEINSKVIPFFAFFRQLLKNIKQDNFNLVLVSVGQRVPCVGGYASFLKSIKKELPGVFFKHIHFDQNDDPKILVDLVEKEMCDPGGADVFYRGTKRLVAVLRRAEDKEDAKLNEESVIVALGGAKGITFSLVKNISRKYRPTIYLAGKSSPENETVRASIAELKKDNPKIYYESLDANETKSLEKFFLKIIQKHQKIDLVINGAGVVNIGFLKEKTDEEINYEFSNKVYPAFNVLSLALKYRPKRIINFSSVISKYGSAGQSIYTSANALISGLTEEANLILKNFGSSAMTVHWPPWDSVGMTENLGVAQKLKEYKISLLGPGQADRLFLLDISSAGQEPVYYLTEEERSFYGFLLNNIQVHQSLIGKMSDSFSLSAVNSTFEKIFDLTKDIYLRDHQIMGVSSVPAAVGLSMFLCLARLYYEEFPILENIVIHNPILIKEEPLKCYLGVKSRDGIFDLSLRSNVLHFSGQASRVSRTKKRSLVSLREAKQEVLMDSVYSDYYFANSLYLGPTFQSIERVFLDSDDNPFIRIDNSRLRPMLNCGLYDKLIQWIDVSFQALGAIGLKHNHKLIPVKVSRLAVFSLDKISNYLYVIPSIKNFNSTEAEGEVQVINEGGEVILEMTGVTLKSINQYDENRLEIVKYKEKNETQDNF